MMGGLENPLIILTILIVILVLFGAKKIPEMMHGLGKGLSEFKRGAREAQDEVQRAITVEPTPVSPAPTPVKPVEALPPVAAAPPTMPALTPVSPAPPADPSSPEKPA